MKAAVSSAFRKPVSSSRKAVSLFHRIGSPLRRAGALVSRMGSLLIRLIRRLRLLPPFRSVDRALQKTWRRTRPLTYHFLPYVTNVLRVLGWVVLVVGVLASILLGLEIMDGGLMVWKTNLAGVAMGASLIVLGIVGSFLAWLFLLVARELIRLFIHVKENTRNTAEGITEGPGYGKPTS